MSFRNQHIPTKQQSYHSLREFYSNEHKDLQQMIQDIQKVEDQFKAQHDECENYLHQIMGKRRQNQKYGNLSRGVLTAKSEQIKSKIKNIDSVSSGIKQATSKVNIQSLIKLPVKNERALNNLFQILYSTLYSEKTNFQWGNFVKLALKHQDGEDFIYRLVNFNFKDMSQQKYQKLMELKNDPQFQRVATKSPYSKDIIQLADWVDYVCLGHQLVIEKARAQKQYDKIRKDVDKKLKGSLQLSQNFWKEASSQIDKYQNQMRRMCSQLKSLSFQMKNIADITNKQEYPNQNFNKTQQIRI